MGKFTATHCLLSDVKAGKIGKTGVFVKGQTPTLSTPGPRIRFPPVCAIEGNVEERI
jgi:hypothetical protein